MISDKFKYFLLGLTLGVFLSLVGLWVLLHLPAPIQNVKEITFEQTIELIKSKEISEVNIKSSEVQLIAKDKKIYYTLLDASDAPREYILKATDESGTKVNLLPKSSGLFLIGLINAVPFIILIGFLALFIVFYNKHLKRKVEK